MTQSIRVPACDKITTPDRADGHINQLTKRNMELETLCERQQSEILELKTKLLGYQTNEINQVKKLLSENKLLKIESEKHYNESHYYKNKCFVMMERLQEHRLDSSYIQPELTVNRS